ncbi:MAG: S8 family serine peptidase, partial [Chitinophagaceae bacterium]
MKRMKIGSCLVFLFCLAAADTAAQTASRFVITFRNKATSPFSISAPTQFLSQRSIERRKRYAIPLDSTDLPVTPRYVDSLRSVATVNILNVSKWLNQVSIQTTDPVTALATINQFSFVLSAAPIAARLSSLQESRPETQEPAESVPALAANTLADFYTYGASYAQVHMHNGEFLHNLGLRGQNMIISMMDAGYLNYQTVKAFDSARANGQILGTYDFVARETSVNEDHPHGMQCFSTIAANIPGQFVGTAPKALFYLYRTEEAATEYPIEEHNWVCAAERSDSAGCHVVSSSLGYFQFDPPFNTPAYNYTYAQMNGNTTSIAIAADLAAKKGLLVVNAAGNEGTSAWRYIMTPADGDSVLAVGAVNFAGTVANFSSYGPSSDGQVKPDLASLGVNTIIQQPNNAIGTSSGTSYAAPNLAGLVACLWQGFPEMNNIQIIEALRRSGSIASAPNTRIGYGIPDVKKALVELTKNFATASGNLTQCKTTLSWSSKDEASMIYEIERKGPGESNFTKISQRKGMGTIFSSQVYTFSDSIVNALAGSYEYRIRQIIDSNELSNFYLPVVSLNNTIPCSTTVQMPSTTRVQVLPNPARQLLTVSIATVEPIVNGRLVINDLTGKRMHSVAFNAEAGTRPLRVNISTFTNGKYFVSVYNNGVK